MTRTPTITANTRLPFSIEAYDSVAAALDYAAKGETGYNFYSGRGELLHTLPYAELRERAIALAHRLAGLGLPRGTCFAIVAETNPEFMVLFFACQYAGLVPVPLPLPMNLGGRDDYIERLRRLIENSRARAAAATADFLPHLREVADEKIEFVGSLEDFHALSPGRGKLAPLDADEPCYIQYSSGSTRFPHGVMVTQRSLLANCRAIIQHGLKTRQGDRCVSWLPLYHDMGLVGFCLAPMLSQLSVDYISTADFGRRPLIWLDIITRNRGTISFSPTFGYHLCVRRAQNGAASAYDLSAWRVAGVGGDMIQPNILEQFAETFAPSRFRPTAFVPSYGLAEFTLAATFAPLGKGMCVDRVDKQKYSLTAHAVPVKGNGSPSSARTRSFVICGQVLPDHDVEIRDEAGNPLPERRIGKVFLKGPSVMSGYFNNTEGTVEVLSKEGWLDTGDMGYMVDGSLVITGRMKDLIIYNGRNIWPQDLEWAVEHLPGLRRGDVAAFAVSDENDSERVIVVVECRAADLKARLKLKRDVAATVRRSAGIECEVVLVPPRSLPHTSSGKLSRATAKARYLAGDYSWPDAPEAEPFASGVESGERASAAARS